MLDPSLPLEMPDELLDQVYLIKPNQVEIEALTGLPVTDQESARRAAQKLLARGVHVVAVQAGAEGNLLVWREGESWHPVYDVKTVDTTGAGDAFMAALAASLAQGKSLSEAGAVANAAAALTTTRLGVQGALPTLQEVQTLMQSRA